MLVNRFFAVRLTSDIFIFAKYTYCILTTLITLLTENLNIHYTILKLFSQIDCFVINLLQNFSMVCHPSGLIILFWYVLYKNCLHNTKVYVSIVLVKHTQSISLNWAYNVQLNTT